MSITVPGLDSAAALTLRGDATPQPRDGGAEARWRELVALIGIEVAAPLTSALERVHALTRTGQIDRAGLRALREEVERARASGMAGQQLARFASGQLRQSRERLSLSHALETALAQRTPELQARGLEARVSPKPADVIVDPGLLASLLATLLDWALANTQSSLELRIESRGWPAQAQLWLRFAPRKPDALDSLAWRLLQQTAWAMGLQVERRDGASAVLACITFARAADEPLAGVTAIELDHRPSMPAKPLAGAHVLVMTAQRELGAQVCDAVRNLGLIVDVVGSVEEAEQFCRDGLPHALVFEAALRGDAFDRLRGKIDAEAPEFVFIEIADESNVFEISGFSGTGIARVGRDAIDSALPAALMVELPTGF